MEESAVFSCKTDVENGLSCHLVGQPAAAGAAKWRLRMELNKKGQSEQLREIDLMTSWFLFFFKILF